MARVLDPHGNVVYESSSDPHSEGAVRQDLDESLGGMVLELDVRAEAIDQLVSGGVPRSRMPDIVALLLLTSGLLVTAVWQLVARRSWPTCGKTSCPAYPISCARPSPRSGCSARR